jgi:hypothetical protein
MLQNAVTGHVSRGVIGREITTDGLVFVNCVHLVQQRRLPIDDFL